MIIPLGGDTITGEGARWRHLHLCSVARTFLRLQLPPSGDPEGLGEGAVPIVPVRWRGSERVPVTLLSCRGCRG